MLVNVVYPNLPPPVVAPPHNNRPAIPRVVCLCGSTKFKEHFEEANRIYTLKGYIVLSVGWYKKDFENTTMLDDKTKQNLDKLHKRKIDIADDVVVLNPGGYIGDSTRGEIEYAKKINKPIYYLEIPTKPSLDEAISLLKLVYVASINIADDTTLSSSVSERVVSFLHRTEL